jgi:hypothetical protein
MNRGLPFLETGCQSLTKFHDLPVAMNRHGLLATPKHENSPRQKTKWNCRVRLTHQFMARETRPTILTGCRQLFSYKE